MSPSPSPSPFYHRPSRTEDDEFDQPHKRRKLTPVPKSLHERVLQSVKQAVYGKAKGGPGLGGTPRKGALNGVSRGPGGGRARVYENEVDELGDEEGGAATSTPIKSPSSNNRRSTATKVQVVTGAGTVGNTTIAVDQTPSRKRGKKFKGWEYVKEGEDVGINNQDAFAKIAEEAAKEAAKTTPDDESSIPVSAKSLRERRPRRPSTPTALLEKRNESVSNVRRQGEQMHERKSSSKKGKREKGEMGSVVAHHVPVRSLSVDELHDGQSSGDEVTPVRPKAPKSHSTPKKRDGLASRKMENGISSGRPDPVVDVDSTTIAPKGDHSQRKLSKHLPHRQSTDDPFTAQPTGWQSAAQEDFLRASAHLESVLPQKSNALTAIKHHLLVRLTGKSRLPVPQHLSKEYETVHQLLSRTVQAGEGNSMLLIGSRGSGKSNLVETAVFDLTRSNENDFHVVRLNGFIHTDDKLALREIWRQLGRELEGDDDDISLRNNYADTLTSLLALLSHQDDSQEGEPTLAAKSVIFVVDEFDLFAQHPRQTLLYNLFDVAQSHRNAPIAVLGLTTKVHVVDSLEKRVKSRFSQRSLHLSLPKTFLIFQDACLEALKYHNPSIPNTSGFKARLRRHESRDQPSTEPPPIDTVHVPENTVEAWNTYARTLLSTEPLTAVLHSYYATSKRPVDFQSAIALPLIYALNRSNLSSLSKTAPYASLASPDSTLSLLPSLSTLQLALLIAACRLEIILSTDICSFEMAYEEYLGLVRRSKVQSSAAGQVASGAAGTTGARSQDVARGAWAGLEHVGLVVPASGGGGKDREGRWRVDVGLEEVGGWLDGEGRAMIGGVQGLVKWCKEI